MVNSELKDSSLFRTESYINGQWVNGQGEFDVRNPATNDVICQVSNATEQQVNDAVVSAKRALKSWSDKSANERAKLLHTWNQLLLHHPHIHIVSPKVKFLLLKPISKV